MSTTPEPTMMYSDGAIQAAAATAANMRNRDYRATIVQNSEMATTFGASLMEDLGASLTNDLEDDEEMKKEFHVFLEEQKGRLVKTAHVNVKQQRQVQTFLSGLQRVQQTLLQQGLQQQERDYSHVLAAEIQTAIEEQAAEQLEMHQEPMVRAMQTTLGMKLSTNSARNESDDELEVLPTGSSTQGLKCPISASFFVEPVKSKVCGHVYSKESLQQLLAQSGHRGMGCPISGCSNNRLTMESCATDRNTANKVKRHLRNQAAQEEARMSQAVDLDLMDDEEQEFSGTDK